MKVVLLAGGFGTRLSEETELKPKPMVEIGGKPILWHIMKMYSKYGFNDFVILLGYKGYLIKEYFANYFLHQSNVTIDLVNNHTQIHKTSSEPWKISLIDTGLNTMTGGRIKCAQEYIGAETFMLTYGDGVSDVNLANLLRFHNEHGKDITVTAVQPEGRFGSLDINNNNEVVNFIEKPKGDGGWINAGFFVCSPKVFEYIPNTTDSIFEREPLERLALDKKMMVFRHSGFWKAMDTLRDKNQLEKLLSNSSAPWVSW